MAEEVSSIGVKLSLNAGSFMSGMAAATERTELFVAAAKEAQTVAGSGSGSKSGPGSSAAPKMAAIKLDLSVSATEISRIRKQIIAGIGTINIPINAQLTKAAQNEAKAVMAAVSTPAVGTRQGARTAVETTVARNLPKRAMGGPVYAHQGYLVGEKRPEVFTPRQSGTIHPDASRFYREQEQAARREAAAERQHYQRLESIRRSASGPVRGIQRIRNLEQLKAYSEENPGLYSRWTPSIRRDMQPGRTSGGIGDRRIREAGISANAFPSDPGMPWGKLISHKYDLGPAYGDFPYRSQGRGGHQGFARRNLWLMEGQQIGAGLDNEPTLDPTSIRPRAIVSRKAVQQYWEEKGKFRFSRGGMVRAQRGYATEAQRIHEQLGGSGKVRVTPLETSMVGRAKTAFDALHEIGLVTPGRTKMHREFYDIERQKIEHQASQLGIPGKHLVDIVAALSSNQPWDSNVEAAVKAIRAVQGQGPAGFANREQLAITERILAGERVTGIKRMPFADAFYDPNVFPVDRWVGRTTTLGMKSGIKVPTDPMEIMRALRGTDWIGKDVPQPMVRRASIFAIEQAAQRWGMDPREAQAEPWGTIRDLDKLAVKHFKRQKGTGLAIPRAAGGEAEGLYHHHGGAQPGQGFLRGVLSTTADWLKDPFMAYQAWLGEQAQGRSHGGYAAKGTRTWMKGERPANDPLSGVPPFTRRTKSHKVTMPEGSFTYNPDFDGSPLPASIQGTTLAGYPHIPAGKNDLAAAVAAIEAHNAEPSVGGDPIADMIATGTQRAQQEHLEAREKGRMYPWKRSDFNESGGNKLPRTHKFEYEGDYQGAHYTSCKHCGYLEGGNHGFEPMIGAKPAPEIASFTAAKAAIGPDEPIAAALDKIEASGYTPEEVAEAKRIWHLMHAQTRGGYLRRGDEDPILKLLLEGGEPWLEKQTTMGGRESWHIERAREVLEANAAGPEALSELIGQGKYWGGRSAIHPWIKNPPAFSDNFKRAFSEYQSLRNEFVPAKNAFQHKFPGKEKLSPALQKLEAKLARAQNQFLKIKAREGLSQPLSTNMHIVGGGWRWAEAEAGTSKEGGTQHYGTGQVPGFWTTAEAPFRDTTDASSFARSFIADERFDQAWRMAWDEGYGGLTHPGYPDTPKRDAMADYYSGARNRFEGGPPVESEAWKRHYGWDPVGKATGPFERGSLTSFPSSAEFLRLEQNKVLAERGLEQTEFPWADRELREAGPWGFSHLNEVELNRKWGPYAGMAQDPDWERSVAGPPAGWQPTVQRDFQAEAKANRAEEAAKRKQERADAKKAKKLQDAGAGHLEVIAAAVPEVGAMIEEAKQKLAARDVPQHEAPEVIAHQAVIDAAEKKKAIEAVAPVVEAVVEKIAASELILPETRAAAPSEPAGRIIGPSLYDQLLPAYGPSSISGPEALERLRAMGLSTVSRRRRAAGGDAGNGLYVVNELGPEAFIEGKDIGKLRANRPDIYRRIPGAHDGMKTGMIDKPSWGMYAPQKDGLIVRREDAHAALAATRADRGANVGDEDIFSSTGPLITSPYGYTPTGPIQPVLGAGGGRTPDMESFVAAIKESAAELEALAEATRKGSTLLGAGATTPPALLGAGPSMIHLPGPAPTMGPTLYGFGEGEGGYAFTAKEAAASAAAHAAAFPGGETAGPGAAGPGPGSGPDAAAAAGAARASRAAREMPEPDPGAAKAAADEWVALGKGIEARGHGVTVAREMLAAGIKRKDILGSFLGEKGLVRKADGGIEGPSGRSPAETQMLKFGYVSEKSERIRGGGLTDIEARMEELRVNTASAAAAEQARSSPRGAAAALGQLFGGGGAQFKRRQAELGSATAQWRARAQEVVELEKDVGARKKAISVLEASGEEHEALDTELIDKEKDLAAARENHSEALTKLEKAEKAVIPSAGNVIKSFGSIVLATSLYGQAFNAANTVIEKGLVPSVASLIDEMLGWQATSSTMTTALGDQIKASKGNVDAVMAQTAASAGLSKASMDFVTGAVTELSIIKAGAKAQAETGGLFRGAMGVGNAPQGLYGGYGGVLNSGLLASSMGGGTGFTESVAGFFNKGEGGDLAAQLNTGLHFVTSPKFRNSIIEDAAAQGPGEQLFATIAKIPGGLEDAASALMPWNKNFGSTFLGGMKNKEGVPYGQAAPPPPGVGVFGGGSGFLAPVLETATGPEAAAFKAYMGDLNSAIDRGAEAAGKGAQAHYDYAKSQTEIDRATHAAIAAGDDYGYELAQQGIVLRDNTGVVIDNGKAYKEANEAGARGKTIVEPGVWAGLHKRQLEAGREANAIQTQRTMNLELPFEMTKQLWAQPLIQPGLGFFPGSRQGAPSASAAGLTGGAARAAQGALATSAQANTALQTIATEGLDAMRADIGKELGSQGLIDFNDAVTEAENLSASIASMTSKMAGLNRVASQANWANQIRLASRALADANALIGKAGGSRLGYLQREQHQIDRASQALNLALQQRQITTQIALAQFQAPGETGEERYMRQKEALAEASIKQRQLGYAQQDYRVAGEMWNETAKRAATDAQKAIEVMQLARNAEGYAIAAQEAISKQSQRLSHTVGRIDSLVGQARGNFSNALSAAAGGVGEFAGSVDTAVKEIYTTLGFRKDRKGNWTKSGNADAGIDYRSSMGHMGRHAEGYAGAATGGGAMFTVGEAGPETVAILRNPRTHMLQGEGGGGGNGPINININGPVVRKDEDITELARCVAEEVERSLSRKGQLLGLRSPAY